MSDELHAIGCRCEPCQKDDSAHRQAARIMGRTWFEPTPDEMLAWLKERGAYLAACDDHLDGNYGVQVSSLPDTFSAPTLQAALEQAVIAVGVTADA